jgi:hypothetical protein
MIKQTKIDSDKVTAERLANADIKYEYMSTAELKKVSTNLVK